MNIGYIVTTLGLGGTENWVELASTELVRRGHKVLVIAERRPFTRAERMIAAGVEVVQAQHPPSANDYVSLFRANRLDIVHLHAWERLIDLMELRNYVGIPLARSHHTVLNHHLPGYIWRTLMLARRGRAFAREWRIVKELDGHICCSDTCAAGIRRAYGTSVAPRVFSVPNAVRVPERLSHHVMSGPAAFLQVGSLETRKQPLASLRAFASIASDHPDATLTFAGDGPLRPELESLAQSLGLSRVVHILGTVHDVDSVYRRCNVIVLPSLREGFPYALLEAAARGLAIVGTNGDGMRDLLIPEETGLSVPVRNAASLCAAFARLANDPALRARLGEGARTRVSQQFGLGRHVDRLLAVYETMISNGEAPADETSVPR